MKFKKRVLACALVSLFILFSKSFTGDTPSASANASFVKNIGGNSSKSASALSITVPTGGVSIGDLIVVTMTTSSGGIVNASQVTDSGNNTYSLARAIGQAQDGSTGSMEMVYTVATTALISGNTITVTIGGTSQVIAISAVQFSQAAGFTWSLSNNACGWTSLPSATAQQCGSTPTISANEIGDAIVVQSGINGANTETWAQNCTPACTISQAAGTSGGSATTNYENRTMYLIAANTSSNTIKATAGTSRAYAMFGAVFRSVANPTPTPTPIPPTNTPTPTPIPPTNTPTPTPIPATNTPTPTPIPATSTPTPTPIPPTATPTSTPILPTATPTNTPIPTNTPTNTAVPTATPTPFCNGNGNAYGNPHCH